MAARVFGLGIGVVILALIWALSFAVCLLCTRRSGFDGGIPMVLLTTIITVILIFFPREMPTVEEAVDVRIVDHYFIPRIIFVSAMALMLLIGVVLLFIHHINRPVRVKLVNQQGAIIRLTS
uniref:Transmembrane protein 218 n=1 Tax=Plectus sambesii TaxID=2011161 RepID=A0A914UUX7_9BILA